MHHLQVCSKISGHLQKIFRTWSKSQDISGEQLLKFQDNAQAWSILFFCYTTTDGGGGVGGNWNAQSSSSIIPTLTLFI